LEFDNQSRVLGHDKKHEFVKQISRLDLWEIEKDFDTTWQTGLEYTLYKLELLSNLIKLISSFLSQKNIHSFGRRRNVYTKGNAGRSEFNWNVMQALEH
jgi:hypothetical protein